MLTYPITLQAGPGPLQAFVPDPDPDAIAASAVALANTDGGVLIVGLDERGAATPLPDSATLDRALQQAAERCTPPVAFAFRQTVITPAGPVLALAIPRGRKVQALHDGQVTVRATRGNRVLNGAEIRQLLSSRSNGEFEAEPVPGATPGSLDPNLVADFLIHRRERLGQSPAGSQDDLLIKMGAVTSDYRVTVAGMLLFGRDPQRWLPASGARFVRIVGGNHGHAAPRSAGHHQPRRSAGLHDGGKPDQRALQPQPAPGLGAVPLGLHSGAGPGHRHPDGEPGPARLPPAGDRNRTVPGERPAVQRRG